MQEFSKRRRNLKVILEREDTEGRGTDRRTERRKGLMEGRKEEKRDERGERDMGSE